MAFHPARKGKDYDKQSKCSVIISSFRPKPHEVLPAFLYYGAVKIQGSSHSMPNHEKPVENLDNGKCCYGKVMSFKHKAGGN